MARLRAPVCVFVAIALVGSTSASATAQTMPVTSALPVAQGPAPAPQSAEVQRVREELDRLRVEFDALRRAYDERLLLLEQRLTQIGGGPLVAPAPPPATAPAASAAAPASVTTLPPDAVAVSDQAPAQASPAASSKVFNPDISVNGNFVGAAGSNPFATFPALQLNEVEAAFRAIVDPYARADFYFAVGPEGAEVEEGFITFTSLPAGLLLKVGKLRAQFGKMNTLHTHALPTVDRPLVTDNLLGGDEGISDGGFSVSHLVKNPYLFLEFTGEMYAGLSDVFQSSARSELVYLGRVRAYRDLTESMNLDMGTSFAVGPSTVEMPAPLLTAVGGGEPALMVTGLQKQLYGIDVTFRYRPLRRAIYQRLNLRTELIWSRQEMPDAPEARAFGMYAYGEYQFARRWYVGARADRSGRILDASAIDTGGSAFLTFWPTEFSQVRGQFRRISFAEGQKANEFLFQFNFTIGAHGAHVF